jgi:hypothetical protein
MRVLQYISYGSNRRYHLELTYSVLSAHQHLLRDPADIRIVLVADEANLRTDLPVENVVVSTETVRQWQLDGTYNHALQAHSMRHVIQLYGAPTVLIDSDTVLKEHPRRLFERVAPGASLLNAREGRMQELREWPEIARIAAAIRADPEGPPLTADSVMYNSGVMGLDPQDAGLLDQVIVRTKAMRAQSSLFTCNQIAASLVFGGLSRLSTCEDLILHYWGGPRQYYQYQIDRMFPEVLRGGGVAAPDAPLAPLQDLPRPGFRHRLLGRLQRLRRGTSDAYAHAYACASNALAARASDRDMANVWAGTAVDVLAYGLPNGPRANLQDFRAFAPAQIDANAWLNADTRKRWKQYWSGEIGPPVA